MNTVFRPNRSRAGFTLVEVLIVVVLIGILFGLVIGGFSYAEKASKRNVTEIRKNVIQSSLEKYRKEFGEYPQPAAEGQTTEIAGKNYDVGGAAMLYQALSGDGTDYIRIASGGDTGGSSNGEIDDSEGKPMMSSMPKEMFVNRDSVYIMIDAFGRPFQYVRAVPVDPNNPTSVPETINNSFDLWSYGDDMDNTTARSIDTTKDDTLRLAGQRWIKNW